MRNPGITTECPSSWTLLALKMDIAMLVLVECPCIAKFLVEKIQRHGNKEQSNQPHRPFWIQVASQCDWHFVPTDRALFCWAMLSQNGHVLTCLQSFFILPHMLSMGGAPLSMNFFSCRLSIPDFNLNLVGRIWS